MRSIVRVGRLSFAPLSYLCNILLSWYHIAKNGVDIEFTKHTTDEKTGISYTLHNDYYLPHLKLPEDNESRFIGKYGRLHHRYLKQNHKGTYISLLTSGNLHSHLADVEEQAQNNIELLMIRLRMHEALPKG